MAAGRDDINSFSLLDLPGELLDKELHTHVINLDSIKVMMTLGETCKKLYLIFQSELDKRAARKLIAYILQSEPKEPEEQTKHRFPLKQGFLLFQDIPATQEITRENLLEIPKRKDIGLEEAQKMILANPRLIHASAPETPSWIAFRNSKYKILTFMALHDDCQLAIQKVETKTDEDSSNLSFDVD